MRNGRRALLGSVALIASLAVSASPATGSAADTSRPLRATLNGRSIPLRQVRQHHCHNLRNPTIRCFSRASTRDKDLGVGGSLVFAAASTPYVTFFEHAYYGGASLVVADPIPHLGVLGWNDAISSFKSASGQRPRWWRDTYYSGTWWQWASGAWVSYVGDAANDQFSSVKNGG